MRKVTKLFLGVCFTNSRSFSHEKKTQLFNYHSKIKGFYFRITKKTDKIYLHFDEIYKILDGAAAPRFPMKKNRLL